MTDTSLLAQAKELERQVGTILSGHDLADLPQQEREFAITIRHQLTDVRLEVQAYEYAQSRDEQLLAVQDARQRLRSVREEIAKAAGDALLSAADVAQLSARIEHIILRLE